MLKNALHKLRDEQRTDERSDGPTSDGQHIATGEESGAEADADEATDATADAAPPINLDQIFGLLRNRRRRDVLWYLLGTEGQVSLSELAESIAARECGKPVSQITSQERKRVYIGLYQGHLSKMDDCGAIRYNQPRGTIERGPNMKLFVDHLPDDEEVIGTTDETRGLVQTLVNLVT